MKKWLNPTDIYSSQRLVSMTLSFDGLFPFKIVAGETNGRTLKFSKFGLALAAFHILFFASSFTLTMWRQESFVVFFFPTEITRLGGYLQFGTSIVAMATIYGSCIYWSKKIQITLDNIARIDAKLKRLHVAIDYVVGFKLNVYCVIGFLVINFAFSTLSFILLATAEEGEMPGFAVWSSYFMPTFIVSIVVIHFFCTIWEIKQRFVYVNQVSASYFHLLKNQFRNNLS